MARFPNARVNADGRDNSVLPFNRPLLTIARRKHCDDGVTNCSRDEPRKAPRTTACSSRGRVADASCQCRLTVEASSAE